MDLNSSTAFLLGAGEGEGVEERFRGWGVGGLSLRVTVIGSFDKGISSLLFFRPYGL